MIRQLKTITLQMVAGANVVTALVMLLVGYSDRVNPAEHPMVACVGLAYPVFIVLNCCFLLFFAIFKWRYVVVPVFAFAVSYFPTRNYCPLNISADIPMGAIKVLSYNVHHFGADQLPDDSPNPIVDYIIGNDADIVCLQEAFMRPRERERLCKVYEYCDTAVASGVGECLALFSHYPIIDKQRIDYASKGNMSVAYRLKINGDTVVVVNNHFETSGLSLADRAEFRQMVKGKVERSEMKAESKQLVVKLAESAKIRAPQAEAVAEYVRKAGDNVILCGDFNDSPISYTHHTIAKELTDCYVATGNGPGISYHHNAIYVRIDNIFCSEKWKPYGCKVDRSIGFSDHYPIYCWLEKR